MIRFVIYAILVFSVGAIEGAWAQQRMLHIGVTLPLSGPAAAYGLAVRNGFELARDEAPERFENIAFHYEDSQLQPARAVSALASLRLRYDLAAHFDFGSATSLALAPLAERQGLLLVSSAYDPAVGRGRAHVMRFANSTGDYVDSLLGDLRRKGSKKLVIVRSDNPFFVDFAGTLKRNLKADESLVIFEVSDTETDFATLVARIERATPQYDALGVFLFTDQAAQLLRRLNRRREGLVLFGTDAFEEVVSSARKDFDLFERMIFPNSDVSAAFVNRYELRFSTAAHVTFAAGAFDFANLVADLSSVCRACDSSELRELIEEPRLHNGARGVYYYEKTPRSGKHFVSAIVMKEIRDGTVSRSPKS